jgi:hypothetical protein
MKARESFKGPAVEGRTLSLELDEHYRRVLHRRRGENDRSPELMARCLRNRMIIQEMKNAYDRHAGVGDILVDARLLRILKEKGRVSNLTRADMEALNHELRELGGSVFGDMVAARVEERIGRFIQQVLA